MTSNRIKFAGKNDMGALSAEVGASDDGDGDDGESGLGNEDDERKDDETTNHG